MKTVKIQVRWAAAHPGLRPSAPGCGDTLKAFASFGLTLGGDQGNLAPGRYGRALLLLKRRDGSMYSQAYVRLGFW